MSRHVPVLMLAVAGAASCGQSAPSDPRPLTLEWTIALPDVAGRIDHLAVELKRDRLFVAVRAGDGAPAEIRVLRPN
jgi:hypothetical protein